MTEYKQVSENRKSRYSGLFNIVTSIAFVKRIMGFSLLWMVLTGWQLNSLLVGGIFILFASFLSTSLTQADNIPKNHINIQYLPSFLYYFITQSLRGGWDTAKLALTPKQKLSPGVINYKIALLNESHLFTFMQVLSLLPGTVSADLKKDQLVIHVLDINSFNLAEIDECHTWVCKLLNDQSATVNVEGDL